MTYIPLSPFQRPISAAHLQPVDPIDPPAPSRPIGKWDLLRDLAKAKAAFGVTERDLSVLQGLLSFHPNDALGGNAGMVIFPSNKAICERLNGMACSTMRRHVARLVQAGLLVRRDSPNGKRYARRDGDDSVCFGFDLSILHQRATEIGCAADAVRAAETRTRRLRETVSLMRRDLAALADLAEDLHPGQPLWSDLRLMAVDAARALRRRLDADALTALRDDLAAALDRARDDLDGCVAGNMSTNVHQNEQHNQNSKTQTPVSEPAWKTGGADPDAPEPEPVTEDEAPLRKTPSIPLHLVVASCPSIVPFYPDPIRHWHQLFDAACHIRPALGISPSAWDDAVQVMGPEQAAIVVLAMLERIDDIRAPGGYLRALVAKAAAGQFSCGPMLMALMSRKKAA